MSKQPEANAFSPHFLELAYHREPPPLSTREAALAGPWYVEPLFHEFAVIRECGGDQPEAVVTYRDTGLLLAAVFPVMGRGPLYWLKPETEAGEYPFRLTTVMGQLGQTTVGHLRCLHEELVVPLSTAEALVRSPRSLAFLLEAAPVEALTRAGRLLVRRLQAQQHPAKK